jgi:O-acetyl-ADP-ribose deacetylase (regulator of RNase III)
MARMTDTQLPRLIVGDITRAEEDAIVNAANETLLGGGGVDGALHRAAGPALLAACKAIDVVSGVRCPTGEARITESGNLASRYVIHAVGPRYGHDPEPARLLESAYRNSFRLAQVNGCDSVAVPAISCGIFSYPLEEAAEVALATSADEAFRDLTITFYLFSQAVYDSWAAVHTALFDQPA